MQSVADVVQGPLRDPEHPDHRGLSKMRAGQDPLDVFLRETRSMMKRASPAPLSVSEHLVKGVVVSPTFMN